MPAKGRTTSATVSEPECRRLLRRLGIISAADWKQWSRANASVRRRLHLPTRPEMEYRNPGFWTEYGGQYPHRWAGFHRRLLGTDDESAQEELAKMQGTPRNIGWRLATGAFGSAA